ncbi:MULTISPECIES: hypothetical protein [Edwardsiella]|uniref:Uncharacterized protein n=1 Tax=Edwardsiella anguillarum TaxID=1821960 RepID=A0ABY8SD64_9GAMM|nr:MULTISPECIES: hypothetical protein [Edwardsiella]KAB0591777.1 hypothetical protein F7P84_07670 [Edwardsiella anguillarum]UBU94775.1 hypothetical protein AAZ33_19845 [Edwardsiella sp. LADL05-105]UOU79300.1 hypothetical protein MUN71_01340 [Edwardsiella anguillarum]WHP80069.1 hypothetical protein MQ090_16690 [Edwardsiella anguillarum]WHP83659.1 hypothetical protein MQ095_18285 [Edwardsiella anguillarum]
MALALRESGDDKAYAGQIQPRRAGREGACTALTLKIGLPPIDLLFIFYDYKITLTWPMQTEMTRDDAEKYSGKGQL